MLMIHIPTTQGVGASGNWALPRKGKEAVGWGQLGLALFQRDRTRLQNGGQAKTVPSFSELVGCVKGRWDGAEKLRWNQGMLPRWP